jgi:hypothetical protein
MEKIKKVDFYVGVFLSKILKSAKNVPALFEETNESKRIEVVTNSCNYNIYIKYSTARINTPIDIRGNKKVKSYWNIPFSENEYSKLISSKIAGYKNCVAIVCTDDELSETWIALLDFDKALKCLEGKTPGGSRRITVIRLGKAREFICEGVGFNDNDSVTCLFDYTKYFDSAYF